MKWHNKLFSLLILCIATFNVNANWQQTQNISLNKGWNAVYISVQTSQQDLALLFADTPIDLVASYFDVVSTVQFIDEPTEQSWKQPSWHKWVAPARKDAFLTNLYQLNSGRGYLIHSKQDYQWQLTGDVVINKVNWQENTFSLVGFDVDPDFIPTFAELLQGSSAHQTIVAYQMVAGEWQLITDPNATLVQPNQAYWIYSRGDSTFSGAIKLKNIAASGLDFSFSTNQLTLSVSNQGAVPLEFTVEHIAGGNGSELVPISVEQGAITARNLETNLSNLTLPLLNEGEYTKLKLRVNRNNIQAGGTVQSLLVISGAGIKKIIPISASN